MMMMMIIRATRFFDAISFFFNGDEKWDLYDKQKRERKTILFKFLFHYRNDANDDEDDDERTSRLKSKDRKTDREYYS